MNDKMDKLEPEQLLELLFRMMGFAPPHDKEKAQGFIGMLKLHGYEIVEINKEL